MTKSEKIANFFKDNWVNFAIVLIVFVYIARGIAEITKTDASIDEIIADGCMSFITSITIKILFRKKAILVGFENPNFKSTCNAYGQQLTDIVSSIDKLDEFCDFENEERRKRDQTTFLIKYGVKYQDFLDGKYDSVPSRKEIDKYHYKILKSKYKGCQKAKKIHSFRYSSKLITNAYDTTNSEKELLTANIKKYTSKQTLLNILLGGVCGILFGYYTLKTGEIDKANVIWCSLQMAIYLAFGLIEYFNTIEYITKTIREKIKRVMSIIDKFKIYVRKGENYYVNSKRNEIEISSTCTK